MNPILFGVLFVLAVVAGVWVGRNAKQLSERRSRSLAGRAAEIAGKRVGGLFRSLVGRDGDES